MPYKVHHMGVKYKIQGTAVFSAAQKSRMPPSGL